jgi:hypothetical protein
MNILTTSSPSSPLSPHPHLSLSLANSTELQQWESTSSLAEAESALTLLAELPDRKQELFIQLGDDLDVFHPFPDLPMELRLMVWRFVRPRPRKVIINPSFPFNFEDLESPIRRIALSQRYNAFPAILYVNSESRREALQSYIAQEGKMDERYGTFTSTCFDPSRDQIQIQWTQQ